MYSNIGASAAASLAPYAWLERGATEIG